MFSILQRKCRQVGEYIFFESLIVFSSRVFSKFKEAIRLIPANIQRDTELDVNSARDIFPSIQPIYRYVKVRRVDLPH